MKKIAILFSMFALLVGCGQYDELDQLGPNNDIQIEGAVSDTLPATLYASVEQESSRAYVGEDNVSVLWHGGDAVSYFGERQNAKYAYDGEDGAEMVTMELVSEGIEGAIEGDYTYAVYPYNEAMAATAVEGGYEFGVTYSAIRNYAEGSFGKGTNVMVAAKHNQSNEGYTFRHAGGYLVVKLYGEGVNVGSITLSALNSDVKLSGSATVTVIGDALPTVEMGAESTQEVTLDCGEGIALGATKEQATEFWFALPTVTFEGGLKISVLTTNNHAFEMQTTKSVTIERGKVQPMAALKFVSNTITPYQLWYTRADQTTTEPITFYDKMTNPFDANITAHYYDSANGRFVIEFAQPVAKLDANAFRETDIKTIVIPNSVKHLGNSLFMESNITEITIPGSVNYVESNFVMRCRDLVDVYFEPSPTAMPITIEHANNGGDNVGVLDFCDSLNALYLNREVIEKDNDGDDFVATRNSQALFGARSLNVLVLGEQVKRILPYMFASSDYLYELRIPNTVEYIGKCAFCDCISIHTLEIEPGDKPLPIVNGYETEGTYDISPFYYSPLTTIHIGRELVYQTETGESYIPSDWEQGLLALKKHSSLESVSLTLWEGIEQIGNFMLYGLPISEFTVPNTVTHIGNGAFQECDRLTSITIPASVTYIGVDAFYNCSALSKVIFESGATPLEIGYSTYGTDERGPFYDSPLKNIYFDREFKYHKGGHEAFYPDQTDEGIFTTGESVESVTVTMGSNVKTISDYMFAYLPISSLTIGNSVKTIGVEAFRDNLKLGSLTIPGSVNKIGVDAFYNCASLSTVIFEPSDTQTPLQIGQGFTSGGSDLGPFYYSPLSTIDLNRELKYIDEDGNNFVADYWDEGVFTNYKYDDETFTTSIDIGEQVKTILPYMFSCTRVKSIWIPNNVTSIGERAFYYCLAFGGLSCNHTTPPTLGDDAFEDCDSMWYIKVPAESLSKFKSADNWSDYDRDNVYGVNFYYTL